MCTYYVLDNIEHMNLNWINIYFSPQTVGVIVRLEKENFQILSMHNKVQWSNIWLVWLITLCFWMCFAATMFCLQILNLKPAAVTRKRDTKYAVALDSENNSIQVKDVIKVIDGPHSVNTFIFEFSIPWIGHRGYILDYINNEHTCILLCVCIFA